jgi:hypothetical protein
MNCDQCYADNVQQSLLLSFEQLQIADDFNLLLSLHVAEGNGSAVIGIR